VDSAGFDRNQFQIIINRWRQNDDEPVAKSEKDLIVLRAPDQRFPPSQ
jgi:hypothetical protein